MSLKNLIAAYDDDALAALANKGVLRRAHKALNANEAQITHFDDHSADLRAGGHQVHIPLTGPINASCDCPASGVCSHIVLAVLALRSAPAPSAVEQDETTSASQSELPPKPPDEPVSKEICGLGEDALRKFAGADWSGALALAGHAKITPQGNNVTLYFSTPQAQVTFVSGQEIKDALYKGPATRRRLVVAAGAVALRDAAGVERPKEAAATDNSAQLGHQVLDDILLALNEAPLQVFRGAPVLAAERFLDLAISARAQAAPRLTSLLTGLSAQAEWADHNDLRFEGGRFLATLANCHALAIALQAHPDDPELQGALRRDYFPSAKLSLWVLGADRWYSAAGARGLSLFGLCPQTGRYYRGVAARGAGMDPAFSPEAAYGAPFWGLASPKDLTGQCIEFDRPRVAADGQIANTQDHPSRIKGPIETASLLKSGFLFQRWSDLFTHISQSSGLGLARQGVPQPALIAPSAMGEPVFDDIRQLYHWPIRDAVGQVTQLSAAPDEMPKLRALTTQWHEATGILILTTLTSEGPLHSPIALCQDNRGKIVTTNLKFGKPPDAGLMARARAGLSRTLNAPAPPETGNTLSGFAQRILQMLADQCRYHQPQVLQGLAHQAEGYQLQMLSGALKRFAASQAPDDLLATAYLCAEITATPDA